MNNSTVCMLSVNNSICFNCCSIFFEDPLQDSLDAPMPWIGFYIAIVSAVCLSIVIYDLFYGFHYSYKLWSRRMYFKLNSLTLTLLAIVTKISVDLTEKMIGPADKFVRVTSLAFMLNAIANFMPCLGSMRNNEILLNMVSLSILVITIDVNVWIRNARMSSIGGQEILVEEVVLAVLMTLSLMTLSSLSIAIPHFKKHIESEFQKVHKRTISNNQVEWGNFNIDEVGLVVKRYGVMAKTGNPEFVIARSSICVIQGVMSLLSTIIICRQAQQMLTQKRWSSSIYKITSMEGIGWFQMLFVLFSFPRPLCRWFFVGSMKSRQTGNQGLKDKLAVETYWTQLLLDWEKRPLPSTTRRLMGTKLAINARKLLLKFCCGVQVVIVSTSKLLQLLSAKILSCIVGSCSNALQDPMLEHISCYVVLLEGEGELPWRFLSNILDKVIIISMTKQHQNLIKLLEKSVNFNGVRDFDSKQIQCLGDDGRSYYCWSLPIVTLASIALALPNITTDKSNQLLGDVSKGLYFVKHIENALYRDVSKSLDFEKILDYAMHKTGKLACIRDAVDVIWAGIELERKWHDIDILEVRQSNGFYHGALQTLSDEAKKIMEGVTEDLDPKNWPPEVISANAMYRTSLTIVQAHRDNNSQTEEQLFERLSIMISDILCACLTNLPRAIALMCCVSDIEEREESVYQAAVLLGESQEILETLQKRELPQLYAKKAAYLEEWRTFLEQDTENPVASIPAETTAVSNSDGDHIIELGA